MTSCCSITNYNRKIYLNMQQTRIYTLNLIGWLIFEFYF